jgi:putative transposase
VGKDRVQRIWRREGLKVPQKQRARGRLWLGDGSCVRLRPERTNHVWSYDLDRGQCAQCGANVYLELTEEQHMDHIVPLAVGGTNDLSNLQLLCAPCNLAKGKQLIDVRSSVPPYLLSARRHKGRAKA